MIRAPRLALVALFLVAPAVFFHEVCLGGKAFLLRDLFNWFYPWRTFAASSLARGELPLWNPYSYAGTPFLANMQSGLLYPPNVVFWIFDFPTAMRLFLVIQFALAAAFTYLMLRALDCRAASAITGAIGYAYGGWMVVHIEFPNKVAAAGWLPLILLGLITWWKGRPWKGLALGSLATSCCITAGYPQTTFTMLLGAGVVWSVAVVAAVAGAWRRGQIGTALGVAGSLPAIAALGSLVAAAQVIPFLEAASNSARRAMFDPQKAVKLGLSPHHFLNLICPRIFGLPGYNRYWGGHLLQFWLGHFYVGLTTLALALTALAAHLRAAAPAPGANHLEGAAFNRRNALASALALLVLASAFCLGDRTPLAPFCTAWLPGFAHFKWLSTTSILIAFALCWLGAFGLDAILDSLEAGRRGARASTAAVVFVVAATCTITAPGLTALVAPAAFERIVRHVVSGVAFPEQIAVISAHLSPARDDAVRSAVIAVLLSSAWLAARAGKLKPALFALLVPLALFVDLKGAATGINFATDPAIYRETPAMASRLRERGDPLFRLYVPDETLKTDLVMYGSEWVEHFRRAANAMLVNLNLPFGLFSASDGDPMQTKREMLYHKMLEQEEDPDARGRLLAADNIGVILKLGQSGAVEMTEIPAFLPRVYVADGARRVSGLAKQDAGGEQAKGAGEHEGTAGAQGERGDEDQGTGGAQAQAGSSGQAPELSALRAMLESGWDPTIEALVEEDFTGEPRPASGLPLRHQVHGVTYTNNSVTIQVEASRPCYLILADAAYPGWEATVDQSPAPVFTANYLFRGIDLPAGRHMVRFLYRPASFRWGVAGSIVGLLVLCACLSMDAIIRRRRHLLE